MPKPPATAKVIAASWNGGTLPVAAVNSAKSDHSAIAPRPVRVAPREDIRGWSRLRRRAVKLRRQGCVLRGSPGSEAGVAPQDEEHGGWPKRRLPHAEVRARGEPRSTHLDGSRHVLAAVDRQRRAGDEAALVGGEEDDGAADLVRGAEAADRDLRDDLRLQHLGIDRLHHLGADVARRDHVDGNAGARAFLGKRLAEADVAGLRGGVVRLAGLAFLAVDRGDGDDAAELALAHAVPDRVRHVEDAV